MVATWHPLVACMAHSQPREVSSTSGRLMPTYFLEQAGVRPEDFAGEPSCCGRRVRAARTSSSTGILPQAGARFSAYALYRSEVALRETMIVGAAGLGRLLGERLAAFDHGAVLTVMLALIALSILGRSWSVCSARGSVVACVDTAPGRSPRSSWRSVVGAGTGTLIRPLPAGG